MIVWLIGLSGAGKTTIGRHVYRMCKAEASNTVFIDGDEVRAIFRHDQTDDDYSIKGRLQNAERITELCAWLDSQDINVVCCILSIFPEMRAQNAKRFSSYFEVYISASMETLEFRDGKGLYSGAKKGEIDNVVGVQIPFPEPIDSDLVVDNSNFELAPEVLAEKIFKAAFK